MSSYRQILYHIVFRTKDSRKTIKQEHHKKETFEDELKRLLKEFGIEYDEKYFP
jgi:REP element-mobilizing transposase RayT